MGRGTKAISLSTPDGVFFFLWKQMIALVLHQPSMQITELVCQLFVYISQFIFKLVMMMLCLPSQWTWNEVKSWFLRLSNNQIGILTPCKIRRKQPFSQTPCQIFGRRCRPALPCYFPRFELFFFLIPFQITGRELYIAVKFGGFYFDFTAPYDIMPVFIRVCHSSENLHIMLRSILLTAYFNADCFGV